MTYKFETHLHTSGCSADGKNTQIEMIDKAKEIGYSGIVITNHFFGGNTKIDQTIPFYDFTEKYKRDCDIGKEYGAKNNFVCLFGFEDKYDIGKEILVYGLSTDVLGKNSDYPNYSLKEKSEFIRKNGGIVVCAHPFRVRPTIPNPDTIPHYSLFDGIEVYNSHNNDDENGKATLFCKEHSLLPFSGGDTHIADKLGGSGISFNKAVLSENDFIMAVGNKDYNLIIKDKEIPVKDI